MRMMGAGIYLCDDGMSAYPRDHDHYIHDGRRLSAVPSSLPEHEVSEAILYDSMQELAHTDLAFAASDGLLRVLHSCCNEPCIREPLA